MSNQSNTPNDKPRTVQDIIDDIKEKSADGTYIFRGEPECHEKVSSNLWRELETVKEKYSDIKEIQSGIIADAREYAEKEQSDFEILTDIQHYGGKTNLIDFSTDYNVALFFACYGSPAECGRIIILQKIEELKQILRHPQTPEIRVCAQKSVFVEPPKGYIEQEYEIICIPEDLKLLVLQHLRQNLPDEISPTTIYNDIHGFIRSQNDYWLAYRDFYSGIAAQNKVDEARTLKEKRKTCTEAIEHYTNALNQNLELSPVYNNRGTAYKDIDEHGLAIADFEKAIRLNPDEAGAYSNRGAVYNNKGDFDLAIEDFNKAIRLNPDYAGAYNNRGKAYNDKGDFDCAIVDFEKAIELNPDEAEPYNNRGTSYRKKGEVDRAIIDFNRAIQLNRNYANAYSNRGNAYSKKDDYNRAIDDFTKAIQLKPNDANIYRNRGIAYGKKDDYDRAIDDFTKAIQLKPNDAIAYNNRGITYSEVDKFDLAIQDFDEAIKLNPDYALAYNNRGATYRDKGNFNRAIEDCNKAIELKPDYADPYNNRGAAYVGKGEVDRAIVDYNKAINLEPDFVQAYYNRGNAYSKKDEYDHAIQNYTKAIELQHDLAEAYTGRGMAYYREADFNRAIEDFDRAIDQNPDFVSTVYCNRGEVWLHLREWHRAKSDLTTAKDMGHNIIASFHNDYKNVADFEDRNGVKLPADLAAMLTPQSAMQKKEGGEGTHELASDAEIDLDEIIRNYDRAWKTLAKP